MDSLPTTSKTSPVFPPPPQPQPPVVSGGMAKEVAPISESPVEAPLITEVGKEVTLNPEVSGAGVRMQSDTIEVPRPIQQLGVTAVGPSAAMPAAAPTIVLPLTDDQIAQGLNQSILSSWRWLAEWCSRQLRQMHLTIKTIHGKIVRTKS